MIFLISSESETDILQRLYFPMVRRRGSGSRPLMPLQGVPHQRLEVGDARGRSHHHPFGPFIIPADRHGVLQGLIQRLPSVGSDIVEGGAHFGIGGRNFFYQHRCRPFRRWSKGEELGPLDRVHRSDHHLPFKPVQFFQRRNKEPKRDSKDHTSEASIVSWFVHQASMQQSPRCSGMSSHTRQHVSAFSSLHDPMMTG